MRCRPGLCVQGACIIAGKASVADGSVGSTPDRQAIGSREMETNLLRPAAVASLLVLSSGFSSPSAVGRCAQVSFSRDGRLGDTNISPAIDRRAPVAWRAWESVLHQHGQDKYGEE